MDNWCQRIDQLSASYDTEADDGWAKTETLKADLRSSLGVTPAHGLTEDLFGRVLDWKLRRQRGRTEKHRRKIEEKMLNEVTACAFRLEHTDPYRLAAVRLEVLSSLPGVGYGVASSIMTLVFPEQYGVIDFRVWKVIFDERRTSFSVSQYLKYLDAVWSCSRELGWHPQKVDYFTWIAYES